MRALGYYIALSSSNRKQKVNQNLVLSLDADGMMSKTTQKYRGGKVMETSVVVREMTLADVDVRIDYFHDATDTHLTMLGVDRTRLPSRADWRRFYEEDYVRPLHQRANYGLLWVLDDNVVGFSTVERIEFGSQAFMHLHIVNPGWRLQGLGTQFVRASVQEYFRVLELVRLFCEPNAFNVAPNRTLQSAGFRYQFTHMDAPTAINVTQPLTRWLFERP